MGKIDKRIDAYIKKAEPFAQPILTHLRELVHKGCPEVEENIKWGMPSFEYKGPYFGMASFKKHCAFGFWKAKLMKDPKHYLGLRANEGGDAMGNFGKVSALKDLPPDKVLLDFFKQAKKLNDEGVKIPKTRTARKELVAPAYFLAAIKKNKMAKMVFEEFSPSNKRDYVEWILDAKTETTREKRIAQAIEWMADGKPRHWKYMKK